MMYGSEEIDARMRALMIGAACLKSDRCPACSDIRHDAGPVTEVHRRAVNAGHQVLGMYRCGKTTRLLKVRLAWR